MTELEHPERRRGGVHSVKMSDGNGGHEQRWIINVAAWRGRIALVFAALALISLVLTTARTAVQFEVSSFCKDAVEAPDGVIYKAGADAAEREVAGLEKDLDKRFDKIENRLGKIETEIETAKSDRERQHREIVNLLRDGS